MVARPVRAKLEARRRDPLAEPRPRGQVRLTQRGPVDAAVSRRANLGLRFKIGAKTRFIDP